MVRMLMVTLLLSFPLTFMQGCGGSSGPETPAADKRRPKPDNPRPAPGPGGGLKEDKTGGGG